MSWTCGLTSGPAGGRLPCGMVKWHDIPEAPFCMIGRMPDVKEKAAVGV